MEIKLNLRLKRLSPSTIVFYKYALQEEIDENSTIPIHIRTSAVDEILQMIENEFEELHKPQILDGILKILHLSIKQPTTSTANIPKFMTNLLAKHSSKEDDHIIATQIVYQILCSLPNDYCSETFRTSGLVAEMSKSNHLDSAKLQTQLALCTSLLIEKFQISTLLETIWDQILTNKSYRLLVHYINSLISKSCIYNRSAFWLLIKTLFSAEARDDRKLGVFLVRKVLKCLSIDPTVVEVDNLFYWSKALSHKLLTSWLTYLTILENLEEKQSHLILPSLETLESVVLGEKTPWIRIVLIQMLGHNNSLVLRWSVNYLSRHFSNLVLANRILEEFLHATNNTWLYNENATSGFKLPAFSTCDQTKFLEVFTKVPLKSVPMHVWLLRMKAVQWSDVESKLVINLAANLRQLQNRFIRSSCRSMFIAIFASNIHEMVLPVFMNFLDAFHSSTDCLSNELRLCLVRKIEISSSPFISFNVCRILRKQCLPLEDQSSLMDAFDKVRADDHKWFRILVSFGFEPVNKQQEFCKEHYGVQINQQNIPNVTLEEAMSEYASKLSWDEISMAVVREATVDWFTTNCADINEGDYEHLLDGGGVSTLINIANPCKRKYSLSPMMIDRLIAELRISVKKMMNIQPLVSYIIWACERDQPTLLYEYVNQILDIDVTNNPLALCVFSSVDFSDLHEADRRQLLLIRGVLYGEPLNGDLRLDYDYAIRMKVSEDLVHSSAQKVRQLCLQMIKVLDTASKELLRTNLIAQSKAMSIRKPRYFENSKHHRLKLRIAQALAASNRVTPAWNEYYLQALLSENNQTNVTYIYEFIVAATISECKLLQQIENLKCLSSSCQVSMFAISYLFTVHHQSSDAFVNKVITLILPWTMGSNFSTRLYAQITIHHLLQQFRMTSFDYLKIAIENSLRESPNAYEKLGNDVRYNFPRELNFLDTDPIIYVTVVPEDEHPSSQLNYLDKYESLRKARNLNLSKRASLSENESDVLIGKAVIEDVQRKMNPDMGFNGDHLSDHEVTNTDMIVVASLIDKLPNLGGIARTSEVLGIKNLVLDSTKHAQHKDFKNLSMTAENWINISEVKPKALQEFLINKKTEGYQIVGAEQTAKSVNFMEFKFPKKCVLLLGHEKEGIPADLISFLDYAVEIPQFGMVRSLNVHVTGALFMYEYCKQHLFDSKVG